jgi:hypothetical protein
MCGMERLASGRFSSQQDQHSHLKNQNARSPLGLLTVRYFLALVLGPRSLTL